MVQCGWQDEGGMGGGERGGRGQDKGLQVSKVGSDATGDFGVKM